MLRLARDGMGWMAATACALALWSPPASADLRLFDRIADASTAIPDGTGNFTSLGLPQVSQGNIVFVGLGSANQRGIYRYAPGGLSTVVNTSTPITVPSPPAGGPLMTAIDWFGLSMYGPDVSFIVHYDWVTNAVWTTRGGLHSAVTDPTSSSGGPTGPTSMSGTRIAYTSWVPPYWGSGPVVKGIGAVAPSGTGGTTVVQSQVLKFQARDWTSGTGISYSDNNRIMNTTGVYEIVSSVGTLTFSDGASGLVGLQPANFSISGLTGYKYANGATDWSDDGSTLAFRMTVVQGSTVARTGLYAATKATGPLTFRTVADDTTLIPGANGLSFAGLSDVTVDAGHVLFTGTWPDGNKGIYADVDGVLGCLLRTGDLLDGKTVSGFSYSPDRPLSGNDFVFTATFDDGTTGLYLAPLPTAPEPAGGLLITGLAALLWRRPRRP